MYPKNNAKEEKHANRVFVWLGVRVTKTAQGKMCAIEGSAEILVLSVKHVALILYVAPKTRKKCVTVPLGLLEFRQLHKAVLESLSDVLLTNLVLLDTNV